MIQLKVPDLACSACVATVTSAIQKLDPAATVQADPKTKLVQVETSQSEETLRQTLLKIGYPAA
ncbi:heavy-metal-associated domain-containing protein [Leptolyngbya sp. FACHB-261]|uniref:heavy-metal-associated domain-containing protein n=1 Tax=Leptolyngbya sp. FACHB-261 TaxID=2692806 RepID=UPI0018F00160|nr:heavy-metal-associated domain-containing protein [Leptolyngbya sp. FACHB-261]